MIYNHGEKGEVFYSCLDRKASKYCRGLEIDKAERNAFVTAIARHKINLPL